MSRQRTSVGLRDASPEDIQRITKKLEREGFTVEHKTHCIKTGDKLPYNGVLVGTKNAKSK